MKKTIYLLIFLAAISCKKKDGFWELRDIDGKIVGAETVEKKKKFIDEYLEVANEYFHYLCKVNNGQAYDHLPLGMQLKSSASMVDNSAEVFSYFMENVEKHPALNKLFYENQVDCSLK